MKKAIAKEAAVATLIITAITIILYLVPFNFEVINPLKQKAGDFDIYDLVYTGKSSNDGHKFSKIYLVQIADNRSEIAAQISKIKTLSPSVLAIDVLFPPKADPGDKALYDEANASSVPIVLTYRLIKGKNQQLVIDSNLFPRADLLKHGGYANLSNTDSDQMVREFPAVAAGHPEYLSFAARIVSVYDRDAYRALEQRNNPSELINYSGNINHYFAYTKAQFNDLYEQHQLGELSGKIVMLGEFTKDDGSPLVFDDLKYTPVKDKIGGRDARNMSGILIHANAIEMILTKGYITPVPVWVSFVIQVCFCFFLLYYIIWAHQRYGEPWEIRFMIPQLILILSTTLLFLLCYKWFSFKVMLMPVMVGIILSVDFLSIYKRTAKFMHRRWAYSTIFNDQKKVSYAKRRLKK